MRNKYREGLLIDYANQRNPARKKFNNIKLKNMKYWYLLIVILPLILLSCSKKDKHERSLNDTGHDIQKLREDVLYRGDFDAYNSLSIECLDYHPGEILPFAIIMENKYNDSSFCIDIYESIEQIYYAGNSDYIDERTAKMAIENLEKAAKIGIDVAISRLNSIPKDNKNLTYKEKFKYAMGN
ncbi:MAG: hypothetical protein H6Q16_1510 [Bacteroidetes bacterium]|nr:hypothetical protein [Bacteroidota bacterium]